MISQMNPNDHTSNMPITQQLTQLCNHIPPELRILQKGYIRINISGCKRALKGVQCLY